MGDYSEWDKFDVDAACEEVEKSDSEGMNGYSSEEEEMEKQKLMIEAIAEKDRGNDWFKKGNYDKAIERYTKGMTLDPLNAVLPANRAMALLKKGLFAAAETDCTLALSIDSTYIKAFQRRASSRTGLDKLELALQDYDQVLKLEPKNKAAQTEKAKIIEKLKQGVEENSDLKRESKKLTFNKYEEKMKGAFSRTEKIEPLKSKILPVADENEISEEGLVVPISKPVHLRSKKQLKRIQIIETSSTALIKDSVPEKMCPELVSEKNDVPCAKVVSKSSGFTKKIENEISEDLAKVDIVSCIPPVPINSTKFFTVWKSLKTIVNRAKYLQQFTSTDYKTIFKSSLDGGLFSELVIVLYHMAQRGLMPEIIVNQLEGLCGLPRIQAVAMFMSKQDQERLRYVIGELENTNPGHVAKWKKVFSL